MEVMESRYITNKRDLDTFTKELIQLTSGTVMIASEEFILDGSNHIEVVVYLDGCLKRGFIPWVHLKMGEE